MNNKCPRCGHEIQNDDDFCTNCGYKLKHDNKKKVTEQQRQDANQVSNKRKPIQKMKVLENSSSDLRIEQAKDIFKKKEVWYVIALIAFVFLIVKANALPKGYSNSNDVIEYCMRRNKFLNSMQKMAQGHRNIENYYGAYGFFDEEDADDDQWQLLQNKKTKRYVFKYSYDGESIPSYVVASRVSNGTYQLMITPVKKNHIAGIFKEEVDQDYVDKHFPAEKYVGYSNDDFEDMDVELDSHIRESDHGHTIVFYDTSESSIAE